MVHEKSTVGGSPAGRRGVGDSARTAYDDKDEPQLDDEEGGEGVLIGRFV